MNSKSKRRWYQFSLQTMFVLTVVVSIPLAWVGYLLNWIQQRRDATLALCEIVSEQRPNRPKQPNKGN